MNWDDLRYFLAVARDGQMLSAAKRLGVSQALISRHINALEESVGVRVLDRSTRGCVPTEDGVALLPVAERIEAEVISALAKIQGQEGISGTVRIGAPDGFGSAFLAPRLGRFREAFPQLNLQLVPMPRSFSLSEREADLAIMVGQPEKGRLRTRKLTDYTLGIYAAETYLTTHGTPATLQDLNAHSLVGHVEDLIYTPELNYTQDILRDWTSVIEVSTAIGQFEAVRAGTGIGILHDFMARGDETLTRLFPEKSAKRSYWIAWHENLRAAPRVQAVVGLLADIVREERALFT